MYNPGVKTFTAGAALEAARRVKLSSGSGTQVEYAAFNEDYVGVTLKKAANGGPIAVALKRAYSGTVEITASAAIAAGATIYGAADGKVSEVSSATDKYGKALEAASGDGAVIESIMDD